MSKTETPNRLASSAGLAAVMRKHKLIRRRHVSGPWYINTPRRRKIRLQDFKGRLYLMGSLYDGIKLLLYHECPLGHIIETYGTPTSS